MSRVVTDRRPPSNNTQRHDRARAAGEIARHRLAAKREQLRRDHAATKLQARVRCAQGGRRAAERQERNEQDAGARALQVGGGSRALSIYVSPASAQRVEITMISVGEPASESVTNTQ